MGRFSKYRLIEKQLERNYLDINDNEIRLKVEHFRENNFTTQGYIYLKQQAEYISFNHDIKIVLPNENKKQFNHQLESLVANEVGKIKQDIRETKILSLGLLIVGIILIVMGFVFNVSRMNLVSELIIIASWVFIWAAVEKFFFERREFNIKRYSLLQLLAATIIEV